MSDIKDGGPAFPISDHAMVHAVATAAIQGVVDSTERDRLYVEAQSRAASGMTLRDYFAAKAMASFMVGVESFDEASLAAAAYRMADAMLRARGAA